MANYKISDFSRYRNCCIRNNFFASGTNEQYMKVYQLMKEGGITLHDLSLATWLCTDGYTLEQIKGVLRQEFREF